MTTVEQIIRALQIFCTYIRGDINFHAEHDQIWAGPDPSLVSEADATELATLGWFIDSDTDSWSTYA